MHRLQRNNTDVLQDRYNPQNDRIARSPIRRQTINHNQQARSPIRSRTPNRNVSPIRNSQKVSLKFISNVSPIKQKQNHIENCQSQLTNGHIKYINPQINDKNYQIHKKGQETIRKTQRGPQENRLFGKLVDKLNSEKKPMPKSNQISYRTSVFGQTQEIKSPKLLQTVGRPQGGIYKQALAHKMGVQTPLDQKAASKKKEKTRLEDQEGLNCLVYKIKSNLRVQIQERRTPRADKSKGIQLDTANTPAFLLKRRLSKLEEEQKRQNEMKMKRTPSRNQVEESNYDDFNMFLNCIEQGPKKTTKHFAEDLVKMSFRVQESMNMSPFL